MTRFLSGHAAWVAIRNAPSGWLISDFGFQAIPPRRAARNAASSAAITSSTPIARAATSPCEMNRILFGSLTQARLQARHDIGAKPLHRTQNAPLGQAG